MLLAYHLVLLAALVFLARLIERARPAHLALAWVVVPLLLMPLWLRVAAEFNWSWFLWAKVWSVVLACAFLCLSAARPMNPRVVSVVCWLFLGVNILEAVAADMMRGHWLNAIAGIILVACMGRVAVRRPGARHGHAAIAFPLGWPWIASYTIWNACFVYNVFPFAFGHHVMVLSAALILALPRGEASWLAGRATTLGLYLVAYCSLMGPAREHLDTGAWFQPAIGEWLAIASLASALLVAALAVVNRWPVTAS